jgi:uncharacterized integral membrane protein
MTINFEFLAIFTMPLIAVIFSLVVYGALSFVSEVIGWIYGQ